MIRRTSRKRSSLRRNSSAEDTALDLIAHAEAATKPYNFDATAASDALDELTRWKSRHGVWPFRVSRYWRVVDALHARQAEHPSLRRNSRMLPYGTTYRSPEDKARLAVEYLSSRDPSDPARQRAELKLARMFRTKSPRTAESVRRKIAAAEATRERTREAYEKAIFAGAPREERLRLMQAFDAADSERFQAQMKLAEMGLRRNSLRPPTWENYNEDTGVVLDRFSSRLDAIREAEDWRRSGHRVSSRKIGLRSNSRRRTSLRRNSADWSTRTAVAAKARAAFARGDSRSANRYLSELSAIDLAMMPRALRRNGDPYSTTFHKDGTITFWSVYDQSWVRHARDLDDADWSSMSPKERARVEKHFAPRRASLHRNRTRRTSRRRTSRR